MRIALIALVYAAGWFWTEAAEPAPRFDPPDQLFRRAPMAGSSRSVVVNCGEGLHVAFDAEKCRVHTAWQGAGLELWGPPYHGEKTPFICTPAGEVAWTFPGLTPWFDGEGKPLEVEYRGVRTESGAVVFLYDLMLAEGEIRVEERPFAVETEAGPALVREFKIGSSGNEIRFLADSAFKGSVERSENGLILDGERLVIVKGGGVELAGTTETVDYEWEVITNEGTEKGNPRERRKGMEARAWVNVPAHDAMVEFDVLIFPSTNPAEVRAPDRKPEQPKVFGAAPSGRPPGGDEFYKIEYFPVPPEIELLVTGMDWLENGDLAVCTWVGEIYIIEGAQGASEKARYRRFARGLNEPLGLAVHKGEIYVVQKGELTRVTDQDGNGAADLFECINDDWGYSGNYHSYSFGPVVDAAGNFYVFTTGQRARWDLPFQGYALRISPDGGRIEPICHGLRAPNGFGAYRGDLFFVDNQGNWVGACKLSQVVPGSFHGFPSSKPAPKGERRRPEEVHLPAVWFPRALAPSSSGMETISDESFGPFQGQLLVGDFQNANVTRVFLEKVRGQWQGAVWPFARNFRSGVNRLKMGPDGKLYVGGVKRTWAAAAPLEYALDRVSFTGEIPFEVREARVIPGGFEIEFTQPVSERDASDPENYAVSQFRYRYHEDYGSPEFGHEGEPGHTFIPITSAEVVEGGRVVRLKMEGLRPGFVTQFELPLVMSADGDEIWHDTFWYTLNRLPMAGD